MNQRITKHVVVAASTAGLRTTSFNGAEHLVVPVVALVEGVIFPMGASKPELALASEFGKVPESWNGRPVMLNHPQDSSGGRISANQPEVLERSGLGYTFNARIEDQKLLVEAWIDPRRAESVPGAELILAALRAGKPVEVSVGVFVTAEQRSGTKNGKAYSIVWRDVLPDHLALLPPGTIGACSVQMGCGAPRAASEGGSMKTLRERFAELLAHFRPSQEGVSDMDVRQGLEAALRASVPGFLGIDAVFPDDGYAVYASAPGENIQYFRQNYSLEGSAVSLSGDAIEVTRVTRFEPVAGEGEGEGRAAANCGCGAIKKTAAGEGEKQMNEKKLARAAALLTRYAAAAKDKKLPCFLAAEDASLVAEWPDEKLDGIEAQIAELEKQETKEEPKPTVASSSGEPKPKTEEEYLAEAPESIRSIVAEHKARAAARRTELVGSLKTAQQAFTEEELSAMPTSHLEKLAAMASAKPVGRDFSAAGVPRAAADGDEKVPAPVNINDRIRAARAAGK